MDDRYNLPSLAIANFLFQRLTLTDYNLAFLVCGILAGSYAADRLNRLFVIACGCVGIMLLSYPIYLNLFMHNWHQALILFILFSFVSGCVIGPLPAALSALFPIPFRCSSVSFCYNIAFLIFGGAGPFINYSLIHITHNTITPMWFVMLASATTLITILIIYTKDLLTNTKA